MVCLAEAGIAFRHHLRVVNGDSGVFTCGTAATGIWACTAVSGNAEIYRLHVSENFVIQFTALLCAARLALQRCGEESAVRDRPASLTIPAILVRKAKSVTAI